MAFYLNLKSSNLFSTFQIMRDIKFQMTIDLYEDCSNELKAKIDPYRAKMDEMLEKDRNAAKKRGKAAATACKNSIE